MSYRRICYQATIQTRFPCSLLSLLCFHLVFSGWVTVHQQNNVPFHRAGWWESTPGSHHSIFPKNTQMYTLQWKPVNQLSSQHRDRETTSKSSATEADRQQATKTFFVVFTHPAQQHWQTMKCYPDSREDVRPQKLKNYSRTMTDSHTPPRNPSHTHRLLQPSAGLLLEMTVQSVPDIWLTLLLAEPWHVGLQLRTVFKWWMTTKCPSKIKPWRNQEVQTFEKLKLEILHISLNSIHTVRFGLMCSLT